MRDFAYHRPLSLAEAVAALKAAADGRLLAGGQTLLPSMKQRLAAPSDLIDLGGLGDLKELRLANDGRLLIGAMTTHAAVAESRVVRQAIPALAALAGDIGDPQVRHRGTLGGSIANNDPAADYPAALLALGASVETDRGAIAAERFFTGLFETALDEAEIVTRVAFPVPERAHYAKLHNPASRYAIVGVFVARTGEAVRVAVTGAGPCVFRMTAMEQALAEDFRPAAIAGIQPPEKALNSDLHASAAFRAHLVTVMAQRAVAACA